MTAPIPGVLAGIVAVLLLSAVPGAVSQPEASIQVVTPNPVEPGDRGEYVVIEFPGPTRLHDWTLTDGETTVRFPDRTVSGRIAVTTHPGAVRDLTPYPIVSLSGSWALANAGDEVILARDGRRVDAVTYRRAPEGYRYVRAGAGWDWERLGATNFDAVTARNVSTTAFVLPDAPGLPIDVLATARQRIYLAAYEFTSERATAALCAASRRGVDVRVLVEGWPVGGMTRRQARLLDDLVACHASVTVLDGPYARYAFHHAKYAVVDRRALVMTENWKPSGTGGRSSRGWGILLESPSVTTHLESVFLADSGWRDGLPWEAYRTDVRLSAGDPVPSTRYPSVFEPTTVEADRVDVLVAPENAESGLVALLASATESIHVQQVSIGSTRHPFVTALIDAARRGVSVRVLLSSAWYVEEDNRAIARALTRLAETDDLDLQVRLARPRSRFEKIHAKGVIVDGTSVAVGSANWNNASVRTNREVVVVVHGRAVGAYYERVFAADWRGGRWAVPVGIVAFTGATTVLAVVVGRRTTRFG